MARRRDLCGHGQQPNRLWLRAVVDDSKAVSLGLTACLKEGVPQGPGTQGHMPWAQRLSCQVLLRRPNSHEGAGLTDGVPERDQWCCGERLRTFKTSVHRHFQVGPVGISKQRQGLRGRAPANRELQNLLLKDTRCLLTPAISFRTPGCLRNLEGPALVGEEGRRPAQRLVLKVLDERQRKRLRRWHGLAGSCRLSFSFFRGLLQRADGYDRIHRNLEPEEAFGRQLRVWVPLKPVASVRGPDLQVAAPPGRCELAAKLDRKHLRGLRFGRVEAPAVVHAAALEGLQDNGEVCQVGAGNGDVGAALRQQTRTVAGREIDPAELCELRGVCAGPHGRHDLVVSTPRLKCVEQAIPEAFHVRIHTPDQGPRYRRSRVHPNIVLIDHAAPASGAAPVGHGRGLLRRPKPRGVVLSDRIGESGVSTAGVVQTNRCDGVPKTLVPSKLVQEVLRHLPRRRIQHHQLCGQICFLDGSCEVENVPGSTPLSFVPNANIINLEAQSLFNASEPGDMVENVVLAEERVVSNPSWNAPGQAIRTNLRISGLGLLQ
mmetsp:Transcript_25358/g.58801  ORF Transcript_25358/g.58801 Transcript_25358/m.58801 type:complete len:545 (-) Transcript_25358:489-2123(-)